MKERTCCFTGHRDMPRDKAGDIKKRLEDELRYLIGQGIQSFYAGGALGFDTLAAQMVLELKEEYNELQLILALPCPEQAQRWNRADISVYEDIKSRADEVIYTSESYYQGCMQKRNRYMVDKSCCCICYMTKQRGGTKTTTEYCRKKGVYVINIAE